MSRLPWMKFHKTDWLREPSLRLCGRAARSLWLDMLCLMHDAEPCGHLMLHGKPLDARELAVLLGDRPKTVERLLAELESARVFDRLDDGTIVCRRMLRDARKAQSGQESAQRRWRRDDSPNGSAATTPPATAMTQSQSARVESPESDQDSPFGREPDLPDWHESEAGEFAVTDTAASGSSDPIAAAAASGTATASPGRLKRPERADQHLAEHMVGQGMDGAQVWSLIGAARDPGHADHVHAARQCEAYSRRFRLGWFADERAWAAPALKMVAGGRVR